MTSTRPPAGLRVQILLSLAGVMLLAFVPLFFAVAQVTRATASAYREEAARGLGRAVAAHVAEVSGAPGVPREEVERAMRGHVGPRGAIAVVEVDESGAVIAAVGEPGELANIPAPRPPFGEAARQARTSAGRALDVIVPAGRGAVVVRLRTDEDVDRTASLVRGVALYMIVFALALMVFGYFSLTRLIVRPIERLAAAADRVAGGARSLEAPPAGAREIGELGSSVRAMTERLLADEQALREKVDELERTTRRLRETREQLHGSERLASVGRLAAGVAHEIGNPIAAIMGMHDLIADDAVDDETREDFMRRMRSETERIHVVVRDLLDYARPESEPTSGHQVAEIAEVVASVLDLVRPQKSWRDVHVDVDVPPGLRARISPQRLTQVLLNLVLNAAAAMEGETASPKISIEAEQTDDAVLLRVTDTGPGVPADVADRVFEPFVTTKEVGAGTGLGLSVCRGIVEGAGGHISLDTSHQGGARFVVELRSAGDEGEVSPRSSRRDR